MFFFQCLGLSLPTKDGELRMVGNCSFQPRKTKIPPQSKIACGGFAFYMHYIDFRPPFKQNTHGPTKHEGVMAEKADRTKTQSLALRINSLRPLNNSLYGTSGEIEPLLTLLQTAKNPSDLKRIAAIIKALCEHLHKTGALVDELATSIHDDLEALSASDESMSSDASSQKKPH